MNESVQDNTEPERPLENNLNINNFNNLEQFLSENEKILFGKVEQEEEKEEKFEVKEEKPIFGFIKKTEEQQSFGFMKKTDDQPKKGGFNFIKKKEEEKPRVDENDISEIKSIYSQNNNYVHDDISVNLEEETHKSVNNTSYVDNKSYHDNVRNGSVKSDKEINTVESKMIHLSPKDDEPKTLFIKKAFQEQSSKGDRSRDNLFIKKSEETLKEIKKEEIVSPKETKSKAEDMLQSKDALDNLIYKIHNIKTKIREKNKEVINLEELLKINIHKEEEAINNNDFDRAQEIENTICETRDRLSKIKINLEDLNKEMSKLRDSEIVVLRHRAKVVEESINSANQLYKTKQNEILDFQNKEYKKHNSDNIKITKLKEKLDFLQSNLKTEKDVK